MKIACFIFARGNSSGLKNKNILKIGKNSLVANSILQAKKIPIIKKNIFVSTDSTKIQKIAKQNGAIVPFTRPSNLATNTSAEILSWKHAIKFFKKKNIIFDYIVSLPATSPLRSVADIKKCINLCIRKKKDFVFTVNKSLRNPYFNMIELKKNKPKIVCKKKIFRRQDAPSIFDMNNACYVFRPEYIMHNNNLLSGNVGMVIMPKARSIDIDDYFDYKVCKMIYNYFRK